MRKSSLKIHKVGDLLCTWAEEDEWDKFFPVYGIITQMAYVQHKDSYTYVVYWMGHKYEGRAPRMYNSNQITGHKKSLNTAVGEMIYK